MNIAQLETRSRQNVRVVRIPPNVKSGKTCELFNNHGRNFHASAKSADPIVYNSVTVELTGLFENMERNMERAVALKKLGNILGKKLGYRIDPRAPTPEEREAASAELPAAIEKRKQLQAQRDARYAAILAADPEYQSLKAAYSEASKAVDKLSMITRHRKITVGTSEGMFFLIKAEGDNWEEVIGKLQTKKAA